MIQQMAVDCLSSAENEEYDEHGRLLLNHHLSAVLELASEWRDTLSYDGPWPAPLLLAQCLFERTFASVPLDSAMDEINLKSPFVKVHLKLFGQLLRLSQRLLQQGMTATHIERHRYLLHARSHLPASSTTHALTHEL